MRPVFLRIEPTFESSFLGSVGVAVLAVFTGAFFAGVVAGLVGAGFGSSVCGGTWLASVSWDGCASGVGFTAGTGLEVAALAAGVSMTGSMVLR